MFDFQTLISRIEDALDENNREQSQAHKIDHSFRVICNIHEIVSQFDDATTIDNEALIIAALLHDIDEPYNRKKDHVELSIIKATNILHELGCCEFLIEKVTKIMSEHSSENIGSFSMIESKVLFDADKIDGLGATGIARVFLLSGANLLSMQEAIAWCRKKIEIAIASLQTEQGKNMVLPRLKYVESFLAEIENENEPIKSDDKIYNLVNKIIK